MPIPRTVLFAWLALCFLSVSAPAAALSGSPFIVNSWSVEDGLPDSEAIAVLQTRDGYLWIGTQHGLVRFDGNQFTVFDQMNTPGLPSDLIVFLYEDRQTNLWIGTQSSGLAMIHDGHIQSFARETAGAGTVLAVQESQKGILFGMDGGIADYHEGRMSLYPATASLFLTLIGQHKIFPSRDGGVWEFLSDFILKFKDNHLEKNLGRWPWGNSPVKAACEDPDGNLVVGTLGAGIFWFDARGNYHHISTADGLSSDFVLSMCFDNEGNLWAGTDGGGLDRVKRKVFEPLENFHPWTVQSVCRDAWGGLWAAFGGFGASYWRSNTIVDYHVGLHQAAWEVLVDKDERVWAGTRNDGLFQFDTNRFVPVPFAHALGPEIFALFESRDGRLWVGSENGLGCRDARSWKFFTVRDGLSGNAVRAIAEDARGGLWIGTENNGLDYFDGQKFTAYRASPDGLPGDDISCLYVDSGGVLWVGTFGHGMARFNHGRWMPLSTRNGLASNSIGYIIGDDEGDLWIGSNRGLMRIPENSLADLADGTNFFCRVYGKADGLPTRECSSGSQPAAVCAPDGRLWFPTIDGLVSVDPAKLKPNRRPPHVLIESVLVDERQQNTNPLDSAWSPDVTVPPGGEQLEIHYTALNFSAPGAVQFKYWLEGYQTVKTDAGDSRVARYADLPPGRYRFHVIACNEDGIWNTNGAVLDVAVQPQFWQTNAFQIVSILLLLGMIVGIVRYVSTQNLHRQVQHLKQQEALERERARIARDLHDQLGANLTQVALLGEMAEADKDLPEEVESHSRQISQTARETTRSLDEIVWAINPSNDTLEGLANYACKYAQEYFALAGVPCRVDFPAQLPAAAIPPEVRHNVFLAFKEAVNNVVKHAQARDVSVALRLHPDHFTLQIEDHGRGLGDNVEAKNRNGLRNMKKRMSDIGGNFSIAPAAGGGTLVQLTVPLK